jgi:hypothetical protein
MTPEEVVSETADAIVCVDASRVPFRNFQPGVGPYGEPQLVKLIAERLNRIPICAGRVLTKRTPDLLIKDEWALEFKIVRPYGDNGREAENWSVNLLHPYQGNVSTIADCWKLEKLQCSERKGVIVIGYEHDPPRVDLMPLIECFEVIAKHVARINPARVEACRAGLIHTVHQTTRILAWEVLAPCNSD